MSRKELLELLIEQMEENERLQAQLNEAIENVNRRRIILENAGSIAEASLALNKVFEAADAAAKEYLENVYKMAEDLKQGSDGSGNKI